MQCFKIYSRDIQKRIDPYFYSPQHDIKLGCYHILTLSDICNVITDGDHGNPQYSEDGSGIPYLRVVDVKNNLINYESMQYITEEYSNSLYKSCFAHENNLLISIVGTLGESVLYKGSTPLAISRGFAILEFNEKVIPEYVLAYTKTSIFNKQIQKNKVGSVQDGIYLQSLKEIKIPIPSLDEQQKIAQLALNAYENKLKREEDVEGIMSSLENEIFEYLDIKNYSSSDKKAFSIKCKDVQNKRLDVYGYQLTPRTVINAIKQSRYGKTITPLNSLILENFAGDWGEDIEKDLNDNYSICNVIRNKNFNNVYNIDYEDIAQRKILNTKKEKILLKKGDILIEKSGGSPQQPVGRVAYIDKDIDNYVFSNFLQCIRINSELCDPEYLFIYLRTIYKLNYMKYIQSQTTGIINLLMDDFLNIPIIILKDKDAQREIVDKYNEMHNKAKQLQEEAKDEFKKTKVEVEKMILGEE